MGAAIAGILADHFFEPAMQSNSILSRYLGDIFGSETGAGMAGAIAFFSSCGLLLALVGYIFSSLRDVEG